MSETLDWLTALVALDQEELSDEIINDTLGVLLKYQDDIQQVQGPLVHKIMAQVELG